jgi:hypothetical protein
MTYNDGLNLNNNELRRPPHVPKSIWEALPNDELRHEYAINGFGIINHEGMAEYIHPFSDNVKSDTQNQEGPPTM